MVLRTASIGMMKMQIATRLAWSPLSLLRHQTLLTGLGQEDLQWTTLVDLWLSKDIQTCCLLLPNISHLLMYHLWQWYVLVYALMFVLIEISYDMKGAFGMLTGRFDHMWKSKTMFFPSLKVFISWLWCHMYSIGLRPVTYLICFLIDTCVY